MGVITYIFVVISTIFPLYFNNLSTKEREEREEPSDKIVNDDGVFSALLCQSEGDQSHHQHYQHPSTRPPQRYYCCGFISQVVSQQNKGTSPKRISELSFKEGTSSCKKSVRCKRSKCGWHAKLLKRKHQLLLQDSARAGSGVLLWPILSGHNISDPFPNSPCSPGTCHVTEGHLPRLNTGHKEK